jgi:hypothetical protein
MYRRYGHEIYCIKKTIDGTYMGIVYRPNLAIARYQLSAKNVITNEIPCNKSPPDINLPLHHQNTYIPFQQHLTS